MKSVNSESYSEELPETRTRNENEAGSCFRFRVPVPAGLEREPYVAASFKEFRYERSPKTLLYYSTFVPIS